MFLFLSIKVWISTKAKKGKTFRSRRTTLSSRQCSTPQSDSVLVTKRFCVCEGGTRTIIIITRGIRVQTYVPPTAPRVSTKDRQPPTATLATHALPLPCWLVQHRQAHRAHCTQARAAWMVVLPSHVEYRCLREEKSLCLSDARPASVHPTRSLEWPSKRPCDLTWPWAYPILLLYPDQANLGGMRGEIACAKLPGLPRFASHDHTTQEYSSTRWRSAEKTAARPFVPKQSLGTSRATLGAEADLLSSLHRWARFLRGNIRHEHGEALPPLQCSYRTGWSTPLSSQRPADGAADDRRRILR